MNINIKATNIELTPAIRDYINEKVGGLEKYLGKSADNSVQAWVEVGMTTKHHQSGNIFRAEIQIRVPHVDREKGVRVESEEADLYVAIDSAREKMKVELRRIGDKKISFIRRSARALRKKLPFFNE